jgi:hypothetical protein
MATFALTWNPERWPWPESHYSSTIATTARGGTVADRWSFGIRRKGASPGDRVFLVRQRKDRGIVGAGSLTSSIYMDRHWDPAKDICPYADVLWDRVLPLESRLEIEIVRTQIVSFNWDRLQGSGVQLTESQASQLEDLWRHHLGSLDGDSPPPLRPKER